MSITLFLFCVCVYSFLTVTRVCSSHSVSRLLFHVHSKVFHWVWNRPVVHGSYLTNPDHWISSLDVWHLTVKAALSAVQNKERLCWWCDQVLPKQATGHHHPVGASPGPALDGKWFFQTSDRFARPHGQVGEEQTGTLSRGGHHHILVGLCKWGLEH